MERPDWIAAQDGRLRGESLDAGFGVRMYKTIQLRLASVDALEMGIDDFEGRELFRTYALGNLLDCEVWRCLHDSKRESKRVSGTGQAPADSAYLLA